MLTGRFFIRLLIVFLSLIVVFLLTYIVITFSSSIQDSIILKATNEMTGTLHTYSDEELIHLVKEGYFNFFATGRSMSVVNKNIDNEIREELNRRIASGSNLQAYIALLNYEGYYLHGNSFMPMRVKELISPILSKHGHENTIRFVQ